jgi:hypothetical protein
MFQVGDIVIAQDVKADLGSNHRDQTWAERDGVVNGQAYTIRQVTGHNGNMVRVSEGLHGYVIKQEVFKPTENSIHI